MVAASRINGRVIVLGSINQDVTVAVTRFPEPGETLHARSVSYRLGGKGANQAAASAHAGVPTFFIGRVGGDAAGASLREELARHGVDVGGILADDGRSGSAFITVSSTGENTILVDAGANGQVEPRQLVDAVDLGPNDVLVLQGEIPPEVNSAAVAAARRVGTRVVLNLAPVYPVDAVTLAGVDVLVVNETECGLVLSQETPRGPSEAFEAAKSLVARGPGAVLVTLGSAGAVWWDGQYGEHVAAPSLGPVVDTTGAGDACVGVLAAALAVGHTLAESVRLGVRAGSTAVLGIGAASAYGAISVIVD